MLQGQETQEPDDANIAIEDHNLATTKRIYTAKLMSIDRVPVVLRHCTRLFISVTKRLLDVFPK